MYCIIYWTKDNECYPVLNVPTLHSENKTLKLFETLKEADKHADRLESFLGGDYKVEARVISIEGVKE